MYFLKNVHTLIWIEECVYKMHLYCHSNDTTVLLTGATSEDRAFIYKNNVTIVIPIQQLMSFPNVCTLCISTT